MRILLSAFGCIFTLSFLVATEGHAKPSNISFRRAGGTNHQLKHPTKSVRLQAAQKLLFGLKNGSRLYRAMQARALVRQGVEIFPILLKGLRSKHPRTREISAEITSSFRAKAAPLISALVKMLKDPVKDARDAAAEALGAIGPKANVAVPALIQSFRAYPNSQESTMYAFCGIGKGAFPAFSTVLIALRSKLSKVRLNATCAIASFGILAQKALPMIIKLLQDPNKQIRRNAIFILPRLGMSPKQRLRHLLPKLNDTEETVRRAAWQELKKLGKPAETALLKALSSPKIGRSLVIARLLVQLGPATHQKLCQKLSHVNWQAQYSIIHALGKSLKRQKQPLCRTAIITLTSAKRWEVRWIALRALGQMPNNPKRLLAVQRALKDSVWQVQFQAAVQSVRWGRREKKLLPILLKGLHAQQQSARRDAAKAFALFGKGSLPLLLKQLQHKVPSFRHAALYAMYQMKPVDIGHTIPALIQAIKDDNKGIRLVATQTLQRIILRDAQAAVSGLLLARQSSRAFVQKAAKALLGGMGKRIVPALKRQLHAKDWKMRLAALQTITQIGLHFSMYQTELKRTTKDKHPQVKQAAKRAISALKEAKKAKKAKKKKRPTPHK